MIDVLFVDEQVILVTTVLMPSVMAVMNLAILDTTALTKFLHQESHATKTNLIQGIDTPTTKGTDHTPIIDPDIGDISAGHSPTTILTTTKAAVLEGTPHTPLPATAAACTVLQEMGAPITPHAVTSTGIVAPHPALTTSPTDITHATPQAGSHLSPTTPTTQHRNLSPEKPNSAQDPHPHKAHPSRTVTIKDSLQILHQIQTVTLIL